MVGCSLLAYNVHNGDSCAHVHVARTRCFNHRHLKCAITIANRSQAFLYCMGGGEVGNDLASTMVAYMYSNIYLVPMHFFLHRKMNLFVTNIILVITKQIHTHTPTIIICL